MTNELIEAPSSNQEIVTRPKNLPDVSQRRGIVIADLNDLSRFAKMIFESGLAPKGMQNAQAVAIAVEMGLEVGMEPMMAIQNVAIINGRPGFYGDAMKAIVEASGLLAEYEEYPGRWCDACECEEDASNKCPRCGKKLTAEVHHGYIVRSLRRGRQRPIITGFNINQAMKAGLWTKSGVWTQYPNRMLMFRARGFNLRDNFPDVLKGFKTTEELADYPPEPEAPRKLPSKKQTAKSPAPTGKEEPAATPKALPGNGEELHRRLRDFEEKLVQGGIITRGELIAHVRWAVNQKFPDLGEDMTVWGPAAISLAVESAVRFEKQRHEQPKQGEPAKPKSQPLKVMGKTLMLLNDWAAKMKLTPADKEELCAQANVSNFGELSEENAQGIIGDLEAKWNEEQGQASQAREPGSDDE